MTPSARAESMDCSQLPQGFQFRTLTDDSGEHRYAVFTPEQYDPAKKWPVVMFLHGAGEKGTDGYYPLFGMLTVALEKWPDSPFVAVFPQCEDLTSRALTGWLADTTDGRRAMKILDDVENSFSIDSNRRILIGWSMGGYGAWSLASAYPKHWSAVMALAGGSVDDHLPLEGLARAKTPVWAISGRGDPLVPYQQSQNLIRRLNDEGGRGTFTLLSGVSHDICQRVFATKETFKWLLNPDSIDPKTIDLESVEPLPPRTQFYENCLVETRVIPDSLALRLGNETFRKLAPDLPELLQSAPLEGKLKDIKRTVGTGADRTDVVLSDVSYRCELSRIWMHAISGGRLGLDIDFQPLVMTFGQTTLKARKHRLRTGPIEIRIGIHKPAVMKLEVQPVIESGQLKLRLLRSNFDFDQGNWYIRPPDQVEGKSDQYTPDQLVAGIVGSLYEGRDEIIHQMLAIVPELIERAESEMQMREAPALARMLSPLPVLVPELKVSPSQIRTDSRGVSVVCNLNISVRGNAGQITPNHTLQVNQIARGDRLAINVELDAITALSQLNIDQNFAQVNVLDISETKFGELADPEDMNQALPKLNAPEGVQLNTILRLLSPMEISVGTSGETPGNIPLVLKSSAVGLDVYQMQDDQNSVPAGRIVFKLSQPILIKLPKDRDAAGAALQVSWTPNARIQFLRGESLAGSPVPEVDAESFEKLFKEAWSSWGQEHGKQTIPLKVSQIGSSLLKLNSLDVSDRQMDLIFETVPAPAETDIEVSQGTYQ